jgi:hypothetical protein
MYLLMVLGLMLVLPIASVVIEAVAAGPSDLFWLIGKWFVFWAAGIRLLLAGVRQIAQPAFTAKTIFESTDPATQKVVQELGFANTAIGIVSVLSLIRPGFVLPAAIAAAIFYGLAGLKHIGNPGKNRLETVATLSDLWIFAVLAIFVIDRIVIGAF